MDFSNNWLEDEHVVTQSYEAWHKSKIRTKQADKYFLILSVAMKQENYDFKASEIKR